MHMHMHKHKPTRTIVTMSIVAHDNLQDALLKHREISRNTVYRHQIMHTPLYNGFDIENSGTASNTDDREHIRQEGLSFVLTKLSVLMDYADFEDTRPPSIRRSHEQQAQVLQEKIFTTTKQAKEYYKYRAITDNKPRWYIDYDKYYQQQIDEDDTPWEQLQPIEQQTRLEHNLTKRRRYELTLSEYTQDYFAGLAHYFGMAPISPHSHTKAAYISAVLEAIGLSYLSIDDEYLTDLGPNRNKAHVNIMGSKRAKGVHNKLQGNFSGTPYMQREYRKVPIHKPQSCTQQDIDWLVSMGLSDVAELITTQNTALVLSAIPKVTNLQ